MPSPRGRKQPEDSRTVDAPRGVVRDNQTIAFWQPRTNRPLTELDAHQIVANTTAFFRILSEWQSGDEPEGRSQQSDTGYS